MRYVRATDLTDYLFCPRKVYFKRVLGLEEEKKEQMLKGTLIHEVFDRINEREEKIVYQILDDLPFEGVLKLYEDALNNIIHEVLDSYEEDIKSFNLSKDDLFVEIKNHVFDDVYERAKNTYSTMKALQEYGIFLWDKIEPKIKTELELISDKYRLVGRIDRVEIYKNFMIPVEIKSGKSSKSHLVQLYAYGLLLKANFPKYYINKGVIYYTKNKRRKEVDLNERKEEIVLNIRDKVLDIVENEKDPGKLNNLNKCKKCFFYPICWKGLKPEELLDKNGN